MRNTNETVKIKVKGVEYEVPKGIKIYDAFSNIIKDKNNKYLACKYNNKIRSFGHRTHESGEIEFLDPSSDLGYEIYLRGMLYILSKAIYDIYPEQLLSINYRLHNSMYCHIKDVEIDDNWIQRIDQRMREIVDADLPINRVKMTRDEAREFYKENKTVRGWLQMEKKENEFVKLYFCEDYFNYFYGIMPMSTGVMNMFEIKKYDKGFLITQPNKKDLHTIPEFIDAKKLHYTLLEYDDIFKILGVSTVHELNKKIRKNQKNMILLAEALHEKKISELAKKIEEKENTKMILIAGPTSSGKTTFANKLSYALNLRGLKPLTISVDNYFVDREETPRDEHGELDFEAIEAIDLELFNNHLTRLIEGEELSVPTFNFKTGEKEYLGNTMKLGEDGILIIEGIHCLNDRLTNKIDPKYKFKVYISALTVLNLDYYNRISTTDTRLIRRILRDHRTRGYSAEQTLELWSSVKRGERKNIFPYQETADFMFNSSLIYELGAFKKHVIPLLKEIKQDSKVFYEADRLINFLEYFEDINLEYVPNDSLVREFIGGSIFDENYIEEIKNEYRLSFIHELEDYIHYKQNKAIEEHYKND